MVLMGHLEELFSQLESSDRLHSLRQESWEKFSAQGLPTKKSEGFQYVPLRECLQTEFVSSSSCLEKSGLPECHGAHLVFVDGRYAEKLSDVTALPKEAVVLSLEEAMKGQGPFLQSHFRKIIKEETDPFALLNLSLHQNGVFIYLPPDTSLKAPLQCLFISTSNWPQILLPRLHLVLGKNSHADLLTTTIETNPLASHLFSPSIDIALEENAELNLLHSTQLASFGWSFETVRATLKKNARLRSIQVTEGGKVKRGSYKVQLKGENAEVELKGLSLLSENRTAHTHIRVEHEAPHTRSMQLFKGVLRDASQSSFEGKIFVRDVAQKTEAYQLNNHLILSPGAVANSKPNLEIFADDVKASHGSTISQIAEEPLFYLKARGIDEKTARYLLVRAFCREMIEGISYAPLLQNMHNSIEVFMKRECETANRV